MMQNHVTTPILVILIFFPLLTILAPPATSNQNEPMRRPVRIEVVPVPRISTVSRARIARPYVTTRHRSYIKRVRPRIRVGSRSGIRGKGITTQRTYTSYSHRNSNVTGDRKISKYLLQIPVMQRKMYRYIKQSRYEQQRQGRMVQRVLSEMRKLQTKCAIFERNATALVQLIERRKKETNNFQTLSMNKIQQIENHQQQQDLQYFQVFEVSNNNTAELSELQTRVDNICDSYEENINEDIPEEENWDQTIPSQDAEEFANYDDVDGRMEELMEVNYQRMSDEVNPRLEEQRELLENLQSEMERHSEELQTTKSKVRNQRTSIEGVSSSQKELERKVKEINTTLRHFHTDMTSTGHRLSELSDQAQAHRLALSDLQSTVANINSSYYERVPQEIIMAQQPAPLLADKQLLNDRVRMVASIVEREGEKVTNLSRSVRSAQTDLRYLSMKSNNLYSILTKQGAAVYNLNITAMTLLMKTELQDNRIMAIESDLSYYHVTMMKLLNIVTNLGRQIRRPKPQYRDCHDLRVSGHTEDGVYELVHDMKDKQVYCNMSAVGGWTVIQKRSDGTQDFDRNEKAYEDGFGDIYGEFWFGLDALRWLTNGRIYTLMVILEDWFHHYRYAFYDQFRVDGDGYTLRISGYHGDAGDVLSESNGQSFKARQHGTTAPSNDCTTSRKSGWWFPSNCGNANPNGPYLHIPLQTLATEHNNFNPTATLDLGLLPFMTWRGEDYPVKKITMQIAPHEAVNEEVLRLFPPPEVDAPKEVVDVEEHLSMDHVIITSGKP